MEVPTLSISSTDLDYIVERSPDLASLKGARLLITGGTGFVGKWLLESLLHANRVLGLGATMVVLSRRPHEFAAHHPGLAAAPGVSLIGGDVRDFALPEGAFSHVIHAAMDVVAASTPLETFEVAADGTRRVLELCRLRGVERVLLLSSGAVYGRNPGHGRLCETSVGAPTTESVSSAYGVGKLVTEWLGAAYSAGGTTTCASARVFAQIGPYLPLDKHFAAGNFILNALNNETIVIKGDGTAQRSYMYAADLAIWLWRILMRGGAGRAYNVGSERAISILDLARAIAAIGGLPEERIEILGRSVSSDAADCYVPDTARARKELDLEIGVDLEDALGRTIDWHRRGSGAPAC